MVSAMSIFKCFPVNLLKRDKARYGLLLQKNGPNRDNVITIVRSYTGLDPVTAAKMLEQVPVMVLNGVSNGVAFSAMRALDMAGAEAVVVKYEDTNKPSGGKKVKIRPSFFASLNVRPITFQPA